MADETKTTVTEDTLHATAPSREAEAEAARGEVDDATLEAFVKNQADIINTLVKVRAEVREEMRWAEQHPRPKKDTDSYRPGVYL